MKLPHVTGDEKLHSVLARYENAVEQANATAFAVTGVASNSANIAAAINACSAVEPRPDTPKRISLARSAI